jgi:hypothetical protein
MKSMPPPHPVCESKFMVLGLRRSFSDDIRETAEKTAKVCVKNDQIYVDILETIL